LSPPIPDNTDPVIGGDGGGGGEAMSDKSALMVLRMNMHQLITVANDDDPNIPGRGVTKNQLSTDVQPPASPPYTPHV
jgi:hypothetical protein